MLASFLGFLILALSASELEWSLLSGLQFLGAKNSESCLTEFRSKFNVRTFGSISKLDFVLCFLFLKFNFLKLMSLISF
ncbi:hypothetical protein P3435_24355 [Vibrio parahaemolyticus]|nr:hypothetical protein [Vibrio parahaemolyticus]